jgi:hypothetical protein
MKQLAPIEAYRESIATVSGTRLGWITGIAFGSLLLAGLVATIVVLAPSNAGGQIPWSLLVGAAAISGVIFGITFPRSIKRRLLRVTEAVYSGTGSYASTAPGGAYTHRLPCSLVNSRLEVGGVLYLGRRLATFVPHSMNLPRHRQPLAIADGTECVVETVARPRTFLATLLGVDLPDLVRIVSAQGAWELNMPRPAQLALEIRTLLGP